MTAERIVSIDSGVVIRGREAWEQEKTSTQASRERWRLIGEALLIGRQMHKADKAFGAWCTECGFGDINRRVRVDAMWVQKNQDAVQLLDTAAAHPTAVRATHRKLTAAPRPEAGTGWTNGAVKHGLLLISEMNVSGAGKPGGKVYEVREKLAAELGDAAGLLTRSTKTEDERKLLDAALLHVAEASLPLDVEKHSREIAALSETAQTRVDRIAKAEVRRLQEAYWLEIAAGVLKRTEPERERLAAERQKALDEQARWRTLSSKLSAHMTQDEFRFVLGCLHPDKQPADRQERYGRAFDIFNRLRDW